uniref:Ig-like domain-containing protein n=1 Tax=Amphilophus citrinellus TaxID=61819 RepID=A0A3Q0RSR9_AMPCI
MKLFLFSLYIFIPLFPCFDSTFVSAGESDVIGSDEPVKANVGQEVILPCHLEPPFNVSTLTVEWKRNNTFVHLYRSRKDDPTSQDNQFKGRTSLFPEEMKKGNISLLLRNVSQADEGLYICHVPKLHSQVRKGNITLTENHHFIVKGTHRQMSFLFFLHFLNVFIFVLNVTVEWSRPDLDSRLVHVWPERPELQNPSYKGRTSLFIIEMENGNISLKISKVKLSDEGRYRCFIPDLHKGSTFHLVVGKKMMIYHYFNLRLLTFGSFPENIRSICMHV